MGAVQGKPPRGHRLGHPGEGHEVRERDPHRLVLPGFLAVLGNVAAQRHFARALRDHVWHADEAELGYGDPRGSEALRRAIAEHLAATRGIACDPSRILITSGTQQGLRLCAEALLRRGDEVWMEDPGYVTARRTLSALGATLVPVEIRFNEQGRAKVMIALATGKKQHDKRADIAKRDWQRDKARVMRDRG